MSITKKDVKNHLRKYHVQYIIGGTVALGALSLGLYYRALAKNPMSNLLTYMEKLAKVDPSINVNDLKWAVIDHKQFLAMIPEEFDSQAFSEVVQNRVGPIIYGKAVIAAKGDNIVAVFPA